MSTGQLEIREQPHLPLRRQVDICADGIQHRLFRSMTTLVVVVLAVAFLMNVLTESVIVRSCKHGVNAQLDRMREVTNFISLTDARGQAATVESLRLRIAAARAGSPSEALLRGWTRMAPQSYSQLRKECKAATRIAGWLGSLKLSQRRVLFGDTRMDDDLGRLSDPDQWSGFQAKLAKTTSVQAPRDLAAVVSGYRDLNRRLTEALESFQQANRTLGEMRSGKLRKWFAESHEDSARAKALTAFLVDHHIELTDPQLASLTAEAHRLENIDAVFRAVSAGEVRQAWEDKYTERLSLDMAIGHLASESGDGEWIAQQVTPAVRAAGLDAEQLPPLARYVQHMRRAEDLKTTLDAEYGAEEGVGTNVFWLVVVSMIVCIVGITNAMLVSVLERFREIATMKCLGAMDGFIATQFLLEAAFLGLVGGVIGVVLGVVIGLGRMLVSFGAWVGDFFPIQDLLIVAGVSIVTGLILTIVASIYPAFRAARMLPMEAMRVE